MKLSKIYIPIDWQTTIHEIANDPRLDTTNNCTQGSIGTITKTHVCEQPMCKNKYKFELT